MNVNKGLKNLAILVLKMGLTDLVYRVPPLGNGSKELIMIESALGVFTISSIELGRLSLVMCALNVPPPALQIISVPTEGQEGSTFLMWMLPIHHALIPASDIILEQATAGGAKQFADEDTLLMINKLKIHYEVTTM